MTTTAWLIGAYESFPATNVTIDAGAPSAETVPAGDYYLHDATASLSLLAQFETVIQNTHASASVFLTEAGKVRITSSGSFDVTWGSDTTLRDSLGFDDDLSSAANYTAANKSPYFWSPNCTESPMRSPLGTVGAYADDGVVVEGATTMLATSTATWKEQLFRFTFVPIARYHSTSEANGEFFVFWQQVLRRAYAWKLYRNVDEDTGSTTEVTLGNPLGPYNMHLKGDIISPFERVAGLEWVDQAMTVDIPCRTVNEIG